MADGDGEDARTGGGRSPFARLATIALGLVALAIAALVAVAVLNPQPEQHRIDYGGFDR